MTNEATEAASLFMGVQRRECQSMNCTRRCSCGYGFGRGFDSRRLHHNSSENPFYERVFIIFTNKNNIDF